ncbi:MAG TPA: hypothetical protein PK280_07055 [Planctomycetota bacterium]|nr:hypothetical protein [Planctomycetota bacterium]
MAGQPADRPAPAPAPVAVEPAKPVAVQFGADGKEFTAEFDASATMAVRRGAALLVRSAGLRLVGERGPAAPADLDVEPQEEPGGSPAWSFSGDRAPGALRARLRVLRSGPALVLAWERSFRDPGSLQSWAYVLDLPAAAFAGRELRADGQKYAIPREPAAADRAQLFAGTARLLEFLDGGKVRLRLLADAPARVVLRDMRTEGRDGLALAFMGAAAGETDRLAGRFCLALSGSADPVPPLVYHAELWPPARPGGPLTAELGILAEYGSPFNPADIAVDALVSPPGSGAFRQPAFWSQDYRLETFKDENEKDAKGVPVEKERLVPWGQPSWRARIPAVRAGEYRAAFEVKTPAGTSVMTPRPALVSEPPPAPAGPLKPAQADPRYLADPAGRPVFLIGHNLAWILSPRPVAAWTDALERMRRTGLNYARVWTCTWSLPLETSTPYVYDQESAWRLDRVLEEAAARGIHVQLCLDNFHDFTQKRDKSPYFSAGGGCKVTRDFFDAPAARAMYVARLRYLAGRWGAAENLLAWELFNELDYCVDKKKPADLAAARRDFLMPWARWAAGELARLDGGRHMVTCSLADGEVWPELSGAPEFALAENHLYLYMPEVGKAPRSEREAFAAATPEMLRFAKPALTSEYGFGAGGGPKSEINEADRLGVHLHNGLWLSTMSGHAGAAALWWWDSYLAPDPASAGGRRPVAGQPPAEGRPPTTEITGEDRYGHYRALATYLKGVDWLAGWKPLVAGPPEPGEPLKSDLTGLRTGDAALFWLSDPANTWYNRAVNHARPKVIRGAGLVIDGLAPGTYLVEWWDTYNGRVTTSSRQPTDGKGSLKLEAPPFTRDVAGKLRLLVARPAAEAAEVR